MSEVMINEVGRKVNLTRVQRSRRWNLLLLGYTLLALTVSANSQKTPVLTGIDVLEAENFERLAGQRIGLITNHTGVNRKGRSTIDLLLESPQVKLVALFSPEHGLFGDVDRNVSSFVDERTGLPVHSLYGETRRPTKEMLEGIEVLVFDIQDIGVRFYTYITTMAYAMEEAAKAGIRFMVLDRPNPINGSSVEGPVLEPQRVSFTGYFPTPVRHGMTVGELAKLFNEENHIGVILVIAKMEGWKRNLWFDEIDLPWINPSPNIRNLREATLYPALGLLESTNLSVGRGTQTPFELFGAPWINASRVSRALNQRKLDGVRFKPVHFTPDSNKYEGKRCHGVQVAVTDRNLLLPTKCGLEIAKVLVRLYPKKFQSDKLLNMIGSEDVVRAVQTGMPIEKIQNLYEPQIEDFLKVRNKHLLY